MAIISRPIGYSLLLAALAGAIWWSNSDPVKPPKPNAKKGTSSKGATKNWEFPASEVALRFDKPEGKLRDIFIPLVYVDKSVIKSEQDELMKIPANMAGGEGDWAYTGMVEVDGSRMALLENGTTHQGGYVKTGDTWKKSRVVAISSASIVVEGPDGSQETVFRFNANQPPKPKPLPDAGFRPMDLSRALNGPIGSQIEITPESPPRPGRSKTIASDAGK